ncbi:hypothetical protein CP532_6690 [Ophiocordyceps camponoti-leonardi (nom. inval.)]|nr:hypothetical protein CP532_6690 [Ophiocordyceps camponoti-leonardi (nom. inval.)]
MKLYATFPDNLADWAQRQPVFFTGSAPTHGRHVNVSPKGMTDTHFAVLSPSQCAYIDRTGSGCETISHAYENGRLCLLFISFGSLPRILRVFCRARVVEWDQPAFSDLVRTIAKGQRDAFDGARAVIVCDIWQVQTSCGFAVPRVKKSLKVSGADGDNDGDDDDGDNDDESSLRAKLEKETAGEDKLYELAVFEARPTLDHFSRKTVQDNKMLDYQAKNNAESIDGLPGLRTARRDAGQVLWMVDARARAKRICAEPEAVAVGFFLAVFLYLLRAGLGQLLLQR